MSHIQVVRGGGRGDIENFGVACSLAFLGQKLELLL